MRDFGTGVTMAIVLSRNSPSRMNDQEWRIRQELACCYRAFVHYGWTDLIFTHISARVPGQSDQYLINPYGLLFDEITASNLIKVDFAGNLISGDYPVNDAGHLIHSAVLDARTDVNAVLHSHTRAGMAVSCMPCGLLPITQQANEMRGLVGTHKYGFVTNDEDECEALGRSIVEKWALILENHGLLSVGRTIGEAFYFMYMLENACKVQVDVVASGQQPITPDESTIQSISDYGMPPPDKPSCYADMSWEAITRLMDKKDPSYRN